MNGHFEIDNTAYPIGYLYGGTDYYKVTDMRNLQGLHLQPISKESAVSVAAKANKGIREGKLSLKDGDTSVFDFVQQELEAL